MNKYTQIYIESLHKAAQQQAKPVAPPLPADQRKILPKEQYDYIMSMAGPRFQPGRLARASGMTAGGGAPVNVTQEDLNWADVGPQRRQ